MRPLVLIAIILSTLLTSCVQANYSDILVTKVFDGDTLLLANGEKVRLIGIDTPEAEYSYKEQERKRKRDPQYYEQARAATEFTRKLVERKQVQLEFDLEKRDKYGRLLAYVWYEIVPFSHIKEFNLPDNVVIHHRMNKQGYEGSFVFLNATIIKSGYATPMPIKPNIQYAGLFYKLYQEAKEDKRGLWTDK